MGKFVYAKVTEIRRYYVDTNCENKALERVRGDIHNGKGEDLVETSVQSIDVKIEIE